MVIKIRNSEVEIFVVVCCIIVIFMTVMQIFALSRKNPNTPESTAGASARKKASLVKLRNDEKAKLKRNRMIMFQAKAKLRKKIRMELQALDKAMAKLLRQKSITPEESNVKINNEVYSRRVIDIIKRSIRSDVTAINSTRSQTMSLQSRSNDRIIRRNISLSEHDLDLTASRDSLEIQKFGLPLPFEHPMSTTQEIANERFPGQNSAALFEHFQNLDTAQEKHFKEIVDQAVDFEDGNFSTIYEENFNKVKKEFQEGTELYVDEESLRKKNGFHFELCAVEPESLVGNTTDVNLNISVDLGDLMFNNRDVQEGGEWKPSTCISRHRVAIIVPYRDRWNHLKVLLYYLMPLLKRQQINYRIFVVEQFGNETFNKGRIMNAAFREALKLFDFQCVTFHDVDLVPEDDRNMYTCTEQPKHMSNSIDKFKYTLPYQGLVGGVLMFKREHFQLVNGYSNMYWGWGAEDDDMTTRILFHGLRIYRPPSNIARYKMVKHNGRKTSEVAIRMRLLRSAAKRSKLEGLSNVNYTLLYTHYEQLYTHFLVDIGHP